MTMLEKLIQVLGDGQWHSTAELVEQVGHRFSATMHRAVKDHGWQVEKRRTDLKTFEYRLACMANIQSLDSEDRNFF